MLQWMGGSRRKVMTSRKSTHKRQKQYFQQKKRQQQTAGLDNFPDGISSYGYYDGNAKSLDILSLMNLAAASQECESGQNSEAREIPELNTSPVNHQFLKCPCISPIASKDSINLKEARANSPGFAQEIVSPKKVLGRSPVEVPSSPNYSSNKNELSVLDFLGGDGVNEEPEGGPVHEAHVAFSVEGLGKVGMGTPAHSPKRPGRFSSGCSLPGKPVRPNQSSKNNNYTTQDIELELNTVIHDIDMPLCGNALELPLNSRNKDDYFSHSRSSNLTGKGCKPVDSHGCKIYDFSGYEEYPSGNMKNTRPWKSKPGFPDENFPLEYDVDWKDRAYNMDSSSTDFFGSKKHYDTDFSIEDSYPTNGMDLLAEVQGDFDITELYAPVYKCLAAEKDHNFIKSSSTRYPRVDRSLNFNPPTWSHFVADDGNDNVSSSSEESCSSTAARGDTATYSVMNSMGLGKSMGKPSSSFLGKKKAGKNLYAEETWYKDSDKFSRGNDQTRSRKYGRMGNTSVSRPSCHTNELSKVQKDLESDSWLPDGGYTSVYLDSGLCSPQITAESELVLVEPKGWSEDLFGELAERNEYPETDTSCKKSRLYASVKCATPSNFSKEFIFPQSFSHMHTYDSSTVTNKGSKSRKPDISQASRTDGNPSQSSHASHSQGGLNTPDVSEKENFTAEGEDKSGSQPANHRNFPDDLKKEVSVEKKVGSGKTVDVPGTNDDSGECMEANDDVCRELTEKPITQAQDSSGHSEETLSVLKKVNDKPESRTGAERCQIEAHMQLLSQIGSKGKECILAEKGNIGSEGNHNKETSYQVMLESYVLKLLCVQKVLKEASEHNSAKKV